jgi:hypothetical protein
VDEETGSLTTNKTVTEVETRDWQPRAWFLERTRPEEFGRTQRIATPGAELDPSERPPSALDQADSILDQLRDRESRGSGVSAVSEGPEKR